MELAGDMGADTGIGTGTCVHAGGGGGGGTDGDIPASIELGADPIVTEGSEDGTGRDLHVGLCVAGSVPGISTPAPASMGTSGKVCMTFSASASDTLQN